MPTRVSILLLSFGALLVGVAYALTFAGAPPEAAPWLLAIGATLVLTGLGLLGAGPRAPRLAAAVLVACACTLLGFGAALLHAPHSAGGPLLFGLPVATTFLLLLSGGLPLVLLPLAYAWAFAREVAGE